MLNHKLKDSFRIIGDIHGKFDQYQQLVADAVDLGINNTIQLGDFGFSKAWSNLISSGIDPNRHKILGGNHDDYAWISRNSPPHYLGDYGTLKENSNIFYIRGASSIDREIRVLNTSWWKEEEILDQNVFADALELFEKLKPDIMITHDCPRSIKEYLVKSNFRDTTSTFLEMCFHVHQPKLWIFGHHHIDFNMEYEKTKFVCLKECGFMDIPIPACQVSPHSRVGHL